MPSHEMTILPLLVLELTPLQPVLQTVSPSCVSDNRPMVPQILVDQTGASPSVLHRLRPRAKTVHGEAALQERWYADVPTLPLEKVRLWLSAPQGPVLLIS